MALGDLYATLPQLKSYLLGSQMADDTIDNDELTDALTSVSREIENHCGRQFNKTTDATARIYEPYHDTITKADDFHTTTGLVIATDQDGDGAYETTWSESDYQLEPLNGIHHGEQGWPYYRIRAVGSRCFPVISRRASVQVTAQWGWGAVPAPVKQACLILAAETHKLRSAPFGVAGFGEFGSIRVRDNPMAAKKLVPYVLDPAKVA